MSQSGSPPCVNCGSSIRSDNKYGICHRPSCSKLAGRTGKRAWRKAHLEDQRAKDRLEYVSRTQWRRSLKIGGACADCGLECTRENCAAFDWDHRPGEVKEFTVGHMYYSRARTLAEVAKCDLRCANCHRIITVQRRAPA